MATRAAVSLIAALLVAALVPPAPINAVPSSVQLEGTLELLLAEDLDAGVVDYQYHLDTARGRVRVTFPDGAPDGFVNGARVRVRGQQGRDGTFAADGGSTSTGVLATAPTWSGSRHLAVVLINFSNNRSKPFSRAFANGVIFGNANSVRAYYAEESGGGMQLTGKVFDWLPLSVSNATCDYRGWESAGKAGLAARGVDLSPFTNFMFVFPPTSSCTWRGLGYLPGPTAWVNGAPSLRTSAHELAHNFGIHHASSLRCTANGSRVTLSTNCSRSEYGDPFTTMGAAQTRHAHALARVQLGYLPPSATKTVTASGTYTLRKSFSTFGVRVIGIPRGDGSWLYLEYRRPHGTYFDNFASTSAAVRGVTIRMGQGWNRITQSALLDTVPSTLTFNDAPLRAGRTFRDSRAGITITVSSLWSGAATVVIKLPADTTPPTAPGPLSVTARSTDSLSLAWSPATDDRAVAGYRVWRDGTFAGSTSATTTAWSATGLAGGTAYDLTVRAVDAAGNLGPAATLTAATLTPDAPPTAPTGLAVTLTTTSARLTWVAATDDRGVAGYRVLQDGQLIGSTTNNAFTATNLQPATRYAWSVQAVDTAGQAGTAATLIATTPAPDTTAPTPVAATITLDNPTWATVRWSAATDDVGVAGYRIYRDGALYATTVAGDRDSRVPRGSTYHVTAVDAAGNESAASNVVEG